MNRNTNVCRNCSNRITSEQTHCSYHQEQKRNKRESEQNQLKPLVQQRTSLSNPQEVTTFTTWWNNNLATVVNYYDGRYWVFLLVYDPVYSTYQPAVFPESYDCSCWGERIREKFSSLSSAKNEASWLRNELSGSYGRYVDNPILLIHPNCDCTRSFETFVTSPYVKNNHLPYSWGNGHGG